MKLSIRKYDGDDSYSYALFKSEDVKGMKGVVFYGQARPIVSGMMKREAEAHKIRMENSYGK